MARERLAAQMSSAKHESLEHHFPRQQHLSSSFTTRTPADASSVLTLPSKLEVSI
jgi:hypothetical protein